MNSATVSTTHVRTIKNSTILIVEDEKEIRRFVRLALEGENWQVFECDTLKRGLIETATRKPDLLILDLGLPDGNGIDLIEDIRQWSDIPIIVLSARDSEQDKVTALDCGADDYLSKPFGINELIARVRVALRRSSKANQLDPVIHFSDIQVDLVNRRVLKGQNELHLTPIEYRLLTELLTNSGKVLTQRHLLNHVWGPNFVEHNHYLRIYMGHLRQKLEADPARPKHLLTETGIGYRFMP
nr:two-component system response regulator KdpE [Xenorhabdus sp. PB62.4]